MMERVKENIILLFMLLLSSVFIYAAFSKFVNFTGWLSQYNSLDFVHDFHLEWGGYALPVVELAVPILFFFDLTKKIASFIATFLMILFSTYLYFKIYIWQDSLCPCGGIFGQLMLDKQFWMNISFLAIAVILNVLQFKKQPFINT